MEKPENQAKSRVAPILPYQWKKGQSGNPKGRPKGRTMKDYARELLSKMTDQERQEFMHGLPKEVIWKMAEGNPDTKEQHEHSGEIRTTAIPAEALAIIEEDLKAKKLHDEPEP